MSKEKQILQMFQDGYSQRHIASVLHVSRNTVARTAKAASEHKPSDKLMVDWAGTTLQLFDKVTGESSKVYLFIVTLPFSMYYYAQACRTMKEEDWSNAHTAMYKFFGGTTRILTPDNLKVGILSNRKYEDSVINRSYQELERFNEASFQKKDGSRLSVFLEEELSFLQPLPRYPYEFARWKSAAVQMNYHIAIDYQNYSIPYEYVRKKVDVQYTKSSIEVYYRGNRICNHKHLHGCRGQYSTIPEHMPVNHLLYSE